MALTSWIGTGDLAKFLGVELSTLNTALADLAVSASQQKIRKHLDQLITYIQNDVVYLDGNGRKKLRLPERPVRRVVLVEAAEGDPIWAAVDADAYLLRGSVLIRWDGATWLHGEANYRITYDHGWNVGAIDSDVSDSDFDTSLNNVPADISLVALSLARRMYEAMGEQTEGVTGDIKQETIGAYSYTLSAAAEKAAGVNLVLAEREVLSTYKIKGVP